MRELLQELTAPPAQTLQILQPTPYTASYTVSTRPIPRTFPTRLLSYAGILLRMLIGLATVLLLWVKWLITCGKSPYWYYQVQSMTALETWRLDSFAESRQWRYLIPAALLIFFLVIRRNYTGTFPPVALFILTPPSHNHLEESLTVLRGLGIQTSTTSSTYLQTPTTRFIPTTNIQDIFIHEAFKGFEVRFYLVIVVEGEEDVVVVFPKLLPRRAVLEKVWRGAKACLWEGKNEAKGKEHVDVKD